MSLESVKSIIRTVRYAEKYCVSCGGKLISKDEIQTGVCDTCHSKSRNAVKKIFSRNFREGWRDFKEVYFK